MSRRAAAAGAGMAGLVSACNALVGVDFGAAHLGDAGSDVMVATVDGGDSGRMADAHRGDARDSAVDGKDARHDVAADAPRPGEGGPDAPGDVNTGTDAERDGPLDAPVDSFSCDPSQPPSAESCVIRETYGVFVAPTVDGGSDSNTGTRAAPFATIGHAIVNANGKRVYVCGATYAEQVTVDATTDGVQIFGGLVCPGADGGAAWSYDASDVATVAPSSAGYALEVEQLVIGAHIEDVVFRAEDAAVGSGGSSVAVFVNASRAVSFTRVTAKGGAGAPGAVMSIVPSNACVTSLTGGNSELNTVGAGATCTCPHVGSSAGGTGVSYLVRTGSTPNDGSCVPMTAVDDGHVGTCQISPAVRCTSGEIGANGANGAGGTPGPSGSITIAGWVPAAGGSGADGDPGQGGGGGGSGIEYSGAGGGAGGCGGSGGAGATAGGASISFAVLGSSVTFSAISLQPGAGGEGGTGQNGSAGQAGGPGGIAEPAGGAEDGCGGGAGGSGGPGGGGAGGGGGPSVGIAWSGTAPILDGTTTTMTATLTAPSTYVASAPGAGGAGGMAGGVVVTGGQGADGTAGPTGAVVQF